MRPRPRYPCWAYLLADMLTNMLRRGYLLAELKETDKWDREVWHDFRNLCGTNSIFYFMSWEPYHWGGYMGTTKGHQIMASWRGDCRQILHVDLCTTEVLISSHFIIILRTLLKYLTICTGAPTTNAIFEQYLKYHLCEEALVNHPQCI